ncbi:hypothetical protein NO1_2045 [Candidatus Termititenax aidoneus]|uniref:Uncharacterized protein n=1 Tax=Termititenax aidoneus TaxID=2218524 RepID=A0A388TFT6_TERA1|nr:hypothetical protein NO1_2045 [Candidatus Termititenax aidoneus]
MLNSSDAQKLLDSSKNQDLVKALQPNGLEKALSSASQFIGGTLSEMNSVAEIGSQVRTAVADAVIPKTIQKVIGSAVDAVVPNKAQEAYNKFYDYMIGSATCTFGSLQGCTMPIEPVIEKPISEPIPEPIEEPIPKTIEEQIQEARDNPSKIATLPISWDERYSLMGSVTPSMILEEVTNRNESVGWWNLVELFKHRPNLLRDVLPQLAPADTKELIRGLVYNLPSFRNLCDAGHAQDLIKLLEQHQPQLYDFNFIFLCSVLDGIKYNGQNYTADCLLDYPNYSSSSMDKQTALNLSERLQEKRILYAERFYPRDVEHILECRSIADRGELKPDDKVAVLIYNRSDWNGAFEGSKHRINDLIKAGYKVCYYEVNSDKEIGPITEKIARQIGGVKFLQIAGHGTASTLDLSENPEPRLELDPRSGLCLEEVPISILKLFPVAESIANKYNVNIFFQGKGNGSSSLGLAELVRMEIQNELSQDTVLEILQLLGNIDPGPGSQYSIDDVMRAYNKAREAIVSRVYIMDGKLDTGDDMSWLENMAPKGIVIAEACSNASGGEANPDSLINTMRDKAPEGRHIKFFGAKISDSISNYAFDEQNNVIGVYYWLGNDTSAYETISRNVALSRNTMQTVYF